jgi:hypothetical protein
MKPKHAVIRYTKLNVALNKVVAHAYRRKLFPDEVHEEDWVP